MTSAAEAALLEEIRRARKKTWDYFTSPFEFERKKIQAESDEYIRGVERALAIIKEVQQ